MKYIVTISGGKDSVAMTDLLLKNNYPVDYVVFNDTSMEFKEMYDYIDKINLYFKKKYNKEIIKISPKIEFKEHIFKKRIKGKNKGHAIGFLSPEMGFCEYRTYNKNLTLKNWLNKNKINNYTLYIGFTNDETKRANKFKENNKNVIFPLIDYFDMSEKDCLKYLKENNLENPLYKYFSRTGCKFCHYQSEQDWYHIWKYFNEDWQELKELEKRIKESNAKHKTIFSKFRTTDDMEETFIQKEKQGKFKPLNLE